MPRKKPAPQTGGKAQKPKIYVVEYGTPIDRHENRYAAPNSALKFAVGWMREWAVRAQWYDNASYNRIVEFIQTIEHIDFLETRREFNCLVDTHAEVTVQLVFYKLKVGT